MTDYADKNRLDRLEEAHAALEDQVLRLRQRLESVHDQVSANSRRIDRIAAIESLAAAPDPVCGECNGAKVITNLTPYGDIEGAEPCPSCQSPTAEPEPEPLDPVLVAIRDLYVLMQDSGADFVVELPSALRNSWRRRVGDQCLTDAGCHIAIRAYGKLVTR